MGQACDSPEPESRRSSSNGKRPDVILSPAWREVSLLVFPGEGFPEIRSPEPAGLMSNHEGSPAGLEGDSHTWETCTPESCILKIYLCRMH